MGKIEEWFDCSATLLVTNWIFLEDDIIIESYHCHVFVSLQKCPRNNMIKAIKRLSYLMIFKVDDKKFSVRLRQAAEVGERGERFFFFSVTLFLLFWQERKG